MGRMTAARIQFRGSIGSNSSVSMSPSRYEAGELLMVAEKSVPKRLVVSATVLLCLIVAITDGDTLKARCGEPGSFQQVTVRLAEIDAPEKAQAFGERSRQHLDDLRFEKAHVRVATKNRYGRTVAKVECEGRDANAEQVRAYGVGIHPLPHRPRNQET